MDDLSATISQFLSNPDNVRQIQDAAASLGLTGQDSRPAQNRQQNFQSQTPPQHTNSGWSQNVASKNTRRGMGTSANTQNAQYIPNTYQADSGRDEDMAAIRGMLEQLMQAQQPSYRAPPPPPAASPPSDMGGLSGILSQLGESRPSANAGGLNLDALSSILGNLGGSAPSGPDLSSLLGIAGQNQSTPRPPENNGGFDMSALSGMLGKLAGGSQGNSRPAENNGGFDMSALSGILGKLAGGGEKKPQSPPGGVSALTAMLGGNETAAGGSGMPGGMDMGMLMKFQQAMSGMSANAGNVKLLLAVKGHLKDQDRIAKVDDAIRVMQVIQFLPLLKESGLFGKIEDIIGNFNLGGIGNMIGSLTGGR